MSNNKQNNKKKNNNTLVNTVKSIMGQWQSANQPRRRTRGRRFAARAGAIGGMVAPLVPEPFGTAVRVASKAARIYGRGEYHISAMPRKNSLAANGPPVFGAEMAPVRVRHREYVQDLVFNLPVGGDGFKATSFPINPGMGTAGAGLFPWLRSLANNFEQYRILGLCFEFKSTYGMQVVSGTTSTASMGIVGLTTVYDPNLADTTFGTKAYAENFVGTQSAIPSKSMIHYVECAPNMNSQDVRWIRTGALGTGLDLKEYDLGKLFIWAAGFQSRGIDVNVGELWVSYDIELMKPLLGGALTAYTEVSAQADPMYTLMNYQVGSRTYAKNGDAFGLNTIGATKTTTNGALGAYLKYVADQDSRVIIPKTSPGQAGKYLISIKFTAQTATSFISPQFFLSGATAVAAFNGGENASYYSNPWRPNDASLNNGNANRNQSFISFDMIINWPKAEDCHLKLVYLGLPMDNTKTIVTNYSIFVCKVPDGVVSDYGKIEEIRDEPVFINLASVDEEEEDDEEEEKFDTRLITTKKSRVSFKEPVNLRKATTESVEILEALPQDEADQFLELMRNKELQDKFTQFLSKQPKHE